MRPKTLHIMARAYQDICAGEDPWTAVGNFKNAWYDYARDHRAALVSEPLKKPDRESEHTRHWAAFCAASVEFLCDRYGLACPAWVFDPSYTLDTPWYGDTIVIHAVPRRERGEVAAELVGIWDQPTKQQALRQLAASTRQIQQALSRGDPKPG